MNEIQKAGGVNAILTFLYIVLVATFLNHAQAIFGGEGTKETVFIPIAMLTLFVFSAGLTGYLVLGKPVMWYLDGRKQEAAALAGYTLASLFVLMVLAFILVYVFK